MSDSNPITRRDALKGGSAAAVAVGAGILQQEIVGVARGQTNEPRIQLGPDYAIDDRSSGLVIEHQSSGATFEYDENQGRWVTTDPLEVPTLVDGAGVSHSGELEDASHDHSGETITPNTVNTDSLLLPDTEFVNDSFLLSDDEAVTTQYTNASFRFMFLDTNLGTEQAVVTLQFNDINFVFQGAGIGADQSTSSLNGTTGPDGTINLSIDGSSNLNIENRSGDERKVTILGLSADLA